MTDDEIKNRISLALKDPILQIGFELICKQNEKLKIYNEKLLNSDIEKHNKIVELAEENDLAKSLLYCTKETCDNCGFVNCENFQMQRKSEPCALYISYKERIKKLEQENDVLIKSYNKLDKAKEIFKEYIRINLLPPIERNFDDEVKLFKQAEQFLKEE